MWGVGFSGLRLWVWGLGLVPRMTARLSHPVPPPIYTLHAPNILLQSVWDPCCSIYLFIILRSSRNSFFYKKAKKGIRGCQIYLNSEWFYCCWCQLFATVCRYTNHWRWRFPENDSPAKLFFWEEKTNVMVLITFHTTYSTLTSLNPKPYILNTLKPEHAHLSCST
jgi:hypothetical protein